MRDVASGAVQETVGTEEFGGGDPACYRGDDLGLSVLGCGIIGRDVGDIRFVVVDSGIAHGVFWAMEWGCVGLGPY